MIKYAFIYHNKLNVSHNSIKMQKVFMILIMIKSSVHASIKSKQVVKTNYVNASNVSLCSSLHDKIYVHQFTHVKNRNFHFFIT